MRIACLGGGPGGLYFAISMKLRDPSAEVVVFERNRPDDTFGWGVVLSDQTLGNLAANDPVSADVIRDHFAYWDDLATVIGGERVVSGGHGFCGIGRRRLLLILQERARDLGVDLRFSTEIASVDELKAEYDVVVASDGLNSRTRARHEDVFRPMTDMRACKFMWLGTHQTFDDAFTFIFEQTEHGWIWAHAYQFDEDTATFIAECSEETYQAFGFGEMTQQESIETLQRVFADHLGGHALMTNAGHIRGSAWINFPRVICERWSHENVVLMGDAAATAHFSIGSGTKLALESAIALADLIHGKDSLAEAFATYESDRRAQVLRIQSAALNSLEWFENIHRYLDFPPVQLNYAQLTRSQRIGHENLRLRDPAWLEGAERWFQMQAGVPEGAPVRPPVEAPFDLGGLRLPGRVVVEAGPGDALGSLARPGVGLILTAPMAAGAGWPALSDAAVPVAARLKVGDGTGLAEAAREAAAAGYAALELDATGAGVEDAASAIAAVRPVWAGPLMLRWTVAEGAEAIGQARTFRAAGADLQVPVATTRPSGRMWGVPASDRIRNEARVPTLAVGGITEADHANAMLLAGRADLVGVSAGDVAAPAWMGDPAPERMSA